jgi:hypothetical protein
MRTLGTLLALALLLAGAWWFLARRGATPAGPGAEGAPEGVVPPEAPAAEPSVPVRAPAVAESGPESVEDAPRPAAIRGTVSDEHGAPLAEDVSVVALDAAGEVVARTRVDGDGGFTLAAAPPAVRIEPRKDGWFARASPAIAGLAGEVRLVLERGGRIEGSLILDPVRGSLGAYLRAVREDDAARWRFGEIRDDGSFAIEGLDTGAHAFELAGDGGGMPVGALVRIAGVPVRRSETTRDPRLQALPLAALVGQVQLVVEDADGFPVPNATVHVLEPGGGVLGRAWMKRDVLAFPVPLDRLVDALVVHEDFRPAQVTLDRPFVRIVLVPGIRVFLRPMQPLQLDRGSIGAFLRLRPELPELEGWPEGVCDVELPMSLGSEPATQVVFPFPGHYRLHVTVLERGGTTFVFTADSRLVPLDEGFEVSERDAGKLRDFWLPPELFEQAEGARAGGR